VTDVDKSGASAIERPRPTAAVHPRIEVREVIGSTDWHHIQSLREAIYVTAENRIGEETGFYGSFDRYNDYSKWFLAMCEGRAAGCVKVIRDSDIGLPYETIIGRKKRAPGQVIAEIGHLLSLSGPMSAPVVLGLMRESFAYCVNQLGATHVVGDVFLDKSKGDAFYRRIGFTTLHGPYPDPRFVDAPLSMIIILEVASLAPRMQQSKGMLKDLLCYLTGACNDPEIRRAAAE
jgi:N-acyl amino acid synthase FeeM